MYKYEEFDFNQIINNSNIDMVCNCLLLSGWKRCREKRRTLSRISAGSNKKWNGGTSRK